MIAQTHKREDVLTAHRQIETWAAQGRISDSAFRALSQWLTDPEFADFVPDIQRLVQTGDVDELEDAFRTHIAFGTGGIRGAMGPGPNRINLRTIGEAARGLARYILKSGIENAREMGVVIAHDTRNNSGLFARETAAVIAGHGIVARLFDGPRATPHLSFALRQTGAVAGVVISASHNPPADNGFKAYWTNGGQVVSPHDKNIIAEVDAGKNAPLDKMDYEHGVARGSIQTLDAGLDAHYIEKLAAVALSDARDIRIVYTPLHGVGATNIAPALQKLGYDSFHIVEAQNIPDGNFPTVAGGIANPEDPGTLALAIKRAAQIHADLVIASDPDADRLGCALPHPQQGWWAAPEELALTGNQIGAILCHYLLDALKSQNALPPHGIVCKTIVTTDLISLIAAHFGMTLVDNLLVGFKYIAEVIDKLPGDRTFVFGAEESHGYLAGDFVRDKDAAIAAVLLAECAAQLKSQGRTVREYLDEIYRTFGYFCDIQKSTYRTGAQGNAEIARIMQGLRQNPPRAIGGHEVIEVIDYQTLTARHLQTGNVRALNGTAGNVLAFTFTERGHTRVTARPSGTEPKIKYYVSATSADRADLARRDLNRTRANVDHLAEEIIHGMLHTAERALQSVTP